MTFSRIYAIWLTLWIVFCAVGPASADPTSYIDEENRFILNGQPFFPLGLYVVQCANGSYDAQLDEIADSPFDTLMNYAVNQCGTNATDDQIFSYLDELESRNLKLIFYVAEYFDGGQADIDTIIHKVNIFKAHPAIISWYLNDERDPDTYLTQLEERYDTIRALDENHPVWSVHWNTGWLLPEAHTTDVLGMDSYPIAHLPITEVSRVADAAAQVGAQTGKPFWLVPQIFSWTDYPWDFRADTGRPPTREEMRAMSYLALNHGAKGLIYYSYFNIRDDADYGDRWPQIKEIAGEIDQLRHVFLSIEQTNENDVGCDSADIDYKLMKNGDGYYLFAVNTNNGTLAAVPFQINLYKKPSTVETLFEGGGQVDVMNGSFEDDFAAYQVHVYYWQGSSDQDGDGIPDDEDNCPGTANPLQEDSDDDGAGDACDSCPNDPDKIDPGLCGCGTADTDSDGDGTPDCEDNCPNDSNKTEPGACGCGVSDTDSDGDGIPDCLEFSTGTDPFDDDTDNDGLLDGSEDLNANGIVNSGETDPRKPDTDGDGVQDGTEKGLTAPQGNHTNMAIFIPDADPSSTTDPCNPDTDGEGLADGQEDVNANGAVDTGETSPVLEDTDGDSYSDWEEVSAGSDPVNSDSVPPLTHRNPQHGVNRSGAVYAIGDCAHCHETFNPTICGTNKTLLFAPLDSPDFCMTCHTETGSAQVGTMPDSSKNISGVFGKTNRHNVTGYAGLHEYPPIEEARSYLSDNPHVECNDCHNPHAAEAGVHNGLASGAGFHLPGGTNDTSDARPLMGAFGVEPTWSLSNWGGATNWPSTSSTATKEYQICFKCHSDYNNNPSGWNSANVDWTDTTGPSAWTDVALEFNPSNQSYHPVVEPLPTQDPGYNGSTDSYGSNRLPPAHTSLLIGDSGLKTGGSVGHIIDSSKGWATNQWQNWGVRFGSTDEAPDHSVLTHDYVRTIGSNSPDQLTLLGYFPDAPYYLPNGVTVYSIEYYAGSGAGKSGTTVTDPIKDFNLYLPSLVGYTVVIQDDPTDSSDTSVDWVAMGVVQSNDATSFTVNGWSVLVGSVPASGNVAYYFSATGQAMMCSDCHSNDEISTTAAQGPHGSAVKWMLKGRNRAWSASLAASNGAGYDGTPLYSVHYTYMGRYAARYENDGTADGLFCLNCHSTVSFSKDGNGLQALGSPTENIHLEHNAPCIQCHVMVPHGSKNSRLIADQDDDISRYAYNNNPENMGVTEFVMKAFGPGGRAAPEGYPTGSHGSSLYCSRNCHDVPVEAPW